MCGNCTTAAASRRPSAARRLLLGARWRAPDKGHGWTSARACHAHAALRTAEGACRHAGRQRACTRRRCEKGMQAGRPQRRAPVPLEPSPSGAHMPPGTPAPLPRPPPLTPQPCPSCPACERPARFAPHLQRAQAPVVPELVVLGALQHHAVREGQLARQLLGAQGLHALPPAPPPPAGRQAGTTAQRTRSGPAAPVSHFAGQVRT